MEFAPYEGYVSLAAELLNKKNHIFIRYDDDCLFHIPIIGPVRKALTWEPAARDWRRNGSEFSHRGLNHLTAGAQTQPTQNLGFDG